MAAVANHTATAAIAELATATEERKKKNSLNVRLGELSHIVAATYVE